MQRIHIRTVLAEIELPGPTGQPVTFSLDYYKTDGTKGRKAAVRKGGLAGGAVPGPATGGFRYNVQATGTLQLVNCQNEQPFALKIDLLTHYNGTPILHG